MLNCKEIIAKLVSELGQLPKEEINRQFIALKAEIDAQVLAPIKTTDETKVKLADAPKVEGQDNEQKPENNEKPESDEERKLRLFGE